ncbi:hypothetical protein HYC85_026355 [Camellia sinensis]|uniref:Peptidase A1 domain-containing protein n=1 Tax=Camellia sinensis TaxID=4442 RepID=A0A7J7G7E0_CAMSI|nr:hypothetical protein HYC85_026355 [Camellia sinensis]
MTGIELPGQLAGVQGAAPLGGSGAAPRRGRGAAPPKQNAKMHSKLPVRACYIFPVFPFLAFPLERGKGRSSGDWKLSASLQSLVKILEGVILRSSGFSYARAHRSLFARSFCTEAVIEIDFTYYAAGKISGAFCLQLLRPSQDKSDTIVVPLEAELGEESANDLIDAVSVSLETLLPCDSSDTVVVALLLRNGTPHLLNVVKISLIGESTKLFQIKYKEGLILFPGTDTHVAVVSYIPLPIGLHDYPSESPDINWNCKFVILTNDSSNPQIEMPCKDIVSICSKLDSYLEYEQQPGNAENANARTGSLRSGVQSASLIKVGQFLARNGDDGQLWKEIADEVHENVDRLFKIIGEAYAVPSDPTKVELATLVPLANGCKQVFLEAHVYGARGVDKPYHEVPVKSLEPNPNCTQSTTSSTLGSKKLQVTYRYGPCSPIGHGRKVPNSTEVFSQDKIRVDSINRKTSNLYHNQDSKLMVPVDSTGFSIHSNAYDQVYRDGTHSKGFLGCDTLTLDSDVITNFEFGCGQENSKGFGAAAGMLGLGRGELSLISQTASKFGQSFSYCLPTPQNPNSGYLLFGKHAKSSSFPLKFTPLLQNPADNLSLYFVELVDITVGTKRLNVSPLLFSSPGTVVDSGTAITQLPQPVYLALRSAFRESMSKYKYPLAPPPVKMLDTCYDLSQKQGSRSSVAFYARADMQTKELYSSVTSVTRADSGQPTGHLVGCLDNRVTTMVDEGEADRPGSIREVIRAVV